MHLYFYTYTRSGGDDNSNKYYKCDIYIEREREAD